jgi:hypothetical protein
MRLNQEHRKKTYANEPTEEGLRQWLVIVALAITVILILLGLRLVIN